VMLLVEEDKAIVELVVALPTIEDETTVELIAIDICEIVILGPSIAELGGFVELASPIEADSKVLVPSEEDDANVVNDIASGTSMTDG
jgi:hypothetical protein